MTAIGRTRGRPVSRISISLPEDLLCDLDRMVEARGFESRSQAVNDMLHQFLMEHKHERGNDVMVGIVALFYNNSVPGLQKQLADLQAAADRRRDDLAARRRLRQDASDRGAHSAAASVHPDHKTSTRSGLVI